MMDNTKDPHRGHLVKTCVNFIHDWTPPLPSNFTCHMGFNWVHGNYLKNLVVILMQVLEILKQKSMDNFKFVTHIEYTVYIWFSVTLRSTYILHQCDLHDLSRSNKVVYIMYLGDTLWLQDNLHGLMTIGVADIELDMGYGVSHRELPIPFKSCLCRSVKLSHLDLMGCYMVKPQPWRSLGFWGPWPLGSSIFVSKQPTYLIWN